jgi:hypothetical protein
MYFFVVAAAALAVAWNGKVYAREIDIGRGCFFPLSLSLICCYAIFSLTLTRTNKHRKNSSSSIALVMHDSLAIKSTFFPWKKIIKLLLGNKIKTHFATGWKFSSS